VMDARMKMLLAIGFLHVAASSATGVHAEGTLKKIFLSVWCPSWADGVPSFTTCVQTVGNLWRDGQKSCSRLPPSILLVTIWEKIFSDKLFIEWATGPLGGSAEDGTTTFVRCVIGFQSFGRML
jgi:hypothetical protein